MTISAELNQRIQSQIDRLDTALQSLQSGAVPDLQPLEKEVSDLCKDLLAAPSAESQQTAEKMREMIGLLESLAFELKDFSAVLNEKDE
jgi:hypothetical protein